MSTDKHQGTEIQMWFVYTSTKIWHLTKRSAHVHISIENCCEKGPYTYKLSDGWVWNAIPLALVYHEQSRYVSDNLTCLDDFILPLTV